MAVGNEECMSQLLTFPFNSYLMLRLEYVLLTQGNELEAKLLRIIEMHMDNERKRLYRGLVNATLSGTARSGQVIEISRGVWVPISHHQFLYDLYGTVKSETTLKHALKVLVRKQFIKTRYQPKKRYDAPEYQLNLPLIEREFAKMVHSGKGGYHFLPLSVSDALNSTPEDQQPIPSEGQSLTSSPGALSLMTEAKTVPNSRNTKKEESDKKEAGEKSPCLPESKQRSASAARSLLDDLSQEEIALVLELRRQRTALSSEGRQSTSITSNDEQTEMIAETRKHREAIAQKVRELVTEHRTTHPALTAETVVQVFEQKQGSRYDEEMRQRQLKAAALLLELHTLPLPLTVDLLECLYDTYRDAWWKEHYGELHVSHLIDHEKSGGQRRIVRWLHRLAYASSTRASSSIVAASSCDEHVAASAVTQQERQIWYQNQMRSESEARALGYNGGWERYRQGEHEADDLDAMVAKLQAGGLLPKMQKEKVSLCE